MTEKRSAEVKPKAMTTNRNRLIAATAATALLSVSLSGCSLIGSSPEPANEPVAVSVEDAKQKWLDSVEERRKIVGAYNEVIANDALRARQQRERERLEARGCPAVSVSDAGAVFCDGELPKKGLTIDADGWPAWDEDAWDIGELERKYDDIVDESKRANGNGTDYRDKGNAAPLNPGTNLNPDATQPEITEGNAAPRTDDEYEGGVYDMPNTKRQNGGR